MKENNLIENKEITIDAIWKIQLAIIIPVFNNLKYTQKCLESLYNNRENGHLTTEQVKIVVTDDGSKDGTSDWITKHFPEVYLLQGNGDLWWSGGVNKGIRFAIEVLNVDYILWWNNDIQPAEDYLKNLFKILSSTEEDVLIGSKIFMLHKNLIWGMGGKFNPKTGARHMLGEQQPDNEQLSETVEADWFPGMGTTIHRSVFEKIGYLDEKNFPQYHGDSDFTWRAKKAGFKLIAYPGLIIKNDNTNTGLIHQGSFKKLYKSLTGIKSNYNFNKDYLFYRKYATSPLAYVFLFRRYFRYIGGFLKWKVLSAIGIKKKAT